MRTELQPVKHYGITFIEPVTIEDWQVICFCGKPFDPFEPGLYAEQHRDGLCSEDCYVDYLVRLGIRGRLMPWVKMRCETADRNLRQRGVERESQATISAERQRRLDKVRELWEAGLSPMEIGKQLGHKHQFVYQDLQALGIDPKPRATEARELLLERIGQLLNEGKQYKEIAPIVGMSPSQVGYIGRTHFKLDGRKRRAAHRTPAALES